MEIVLLVHCLLLLSLKSKLKMDSRNLQFVRLNNYEKIKLRNKIH